MRIPALVVALLLVFSGAVPVAAGTAGSSPLDAESAVPRAQVDGAPDSNPRTVMQVFLQDDGDARWHVEVHYRLDEANETTAFERIGQEYETGESDVGVSADLFRRIADRVSESTGREMRIQNATYDYSVDRSAERGTLTLEFGWTNFLRETESGGLSLGDVFVLPSAESEEPQTWLSLMSADQRLVIETPPGYATDTTSIRVKQQNNAIIVDGPSKFEGEDTLVVTYRPTEDAQEIPWNLVVGGGVVAALLFVVGAVIFRWQADTEDGTDGGPPGAPSPTPDAGGGGAANRGVGEEPPSKAGDPEVESPEAEAAAEESEAEEAVDLSLLSDEERVEHLLDRNGGRMKQANIVKETGWSDAKVSQLLSAMADEGRVNKLRLGRENLISLPDGEE
jgi:hypothetical protein